MRGYQRLASIDVGTNSTRMLVADCDGFVTKTIDRRMVITRLGKAVDGTGKLDSEAIERTLSVLSEYARLLSSHKPERVSVAATSALRDSANAGDFVSRAGEITGSEVEILPGEEEARLSFLGAVSNLPRGKVGSRGKREIFVFDIGGGSTELIVGNLPRKRSRLLYEEPRVRSIQVGCVRMSERFLKGDPPSPLALGRMESYLVSTLKPALDSLFQGKPSLVVGLAGTVTTVAAIKLGLTEYNSEAIHHSFLLREEVEEIYRKLASVPLSDRKKIMGLEPERADIIVGGIAVLRAVMDLARVSEILVSEKDILDGLILRLHARVREGTPAS
ncbi:MAG: Ppx/GppA phosphatase family protein [Actinomycetota bacterium]|nr:Ppx/GppA phosphatase family protein [Actinomycetota bacterium]